MHFELRVPAGTKNIELWLSTVPVGKRNPTWQLFHSYTQQEQYPLGTDRLVNNRRNLFIDVMTLVEENASADNAHKEVGVTGTTSEENADYSVTSVKNLAQRAARVAADGSGNARRFKDARALWSVLSERTEKLLGQSLTDSITNVRKSHNWKKNQAYKNVTVHPQAWFVFNVYSRSNPRKDPFTAIHGVRALWDFMRETHADDEAIIALVEQQENAATANCDYPSYGDIAALMGDSNMLVFPDDEHFVQWIRQVAGTTDEVARETLVEAFITPQDNLDEDDEGYIPAHSTGTALHLANVLDKRA